VKRLRLLLLCGVTTFVGAVLVIRLWPRAPEADIFPDKPISVDESIRRYRLVVPHRLPADRVPIVFAFHGIGDSTASMSDYSELNRLATKSGFILVYPAARKSMWATTNLDVSDLDAHPDIRFFDRTKKRGTILPFAAQLRSVIGDTPRYSAASPIRSYWWSLEISTRMQTESAHPSPVEYTNLSNHCQQGKSEMRPALILQRNADRVIRNSEAGNVSNSIATGAAVRQTLHGIFWQHLAHTRENMSACRKELASLCAEHVVRNANHLVVNVDQVERIFCPLACPSATRRGSAALSDDDPLIPVPAWIHV
jgi:hypothetical protein